MQHHVLTSIIYLIIIDNALISLLFVELLDVIFLSANVNDALLFLQCVLCSKKRNIFTATFSQLLRFFKIFEFVLGTPKRLRLKMFTFLQSWGNTSHGVELDETNYLICCDQS